MQSASASSPLLSHRINAFFANARFLTFSMLLHLLFLVFGSTYVFYQQIAPAPDFVAGGEAGLLSASDGEQIPDVPPETRPPELPPSSAVAAPSSAMIDALSTASTLSSFSVNNIPVRGLAAGSLPSGAGLDAKGIGEKIGQVGMGKPGGTSMIRFFGKMAEVRAVVFVVDISGSMVSGTKSPRTYDELEDEVKKVIRSLDMHTRFGLVAFSGAAHLYKPALVAATSEEKQRAINWLRKQSPIGYEKFRDEEAKAKHRGTRADLGLKAAFDLNPDTVIFVSDGEPSGSSPTAVLKLVANWQQGRTRPVKVNSFAYLADSGQKFMRDLATRTAGEFREINPKDRKGR